MKKKIEDFLHLYLGCLCKTDLGNVGELVAIQTHGNQPSGKRYCIKNSVDSAGVTWYCSYHFKPILRPLSDMTEEEENQFCQHMAWIPPKAHYYLSSYTNDLVVSSKSISYLPCR